MWQLQNLLQMIERRKALRRCKRCRLVHKKDLNECPRCNNMTDGEVFLFLKILADERTGLGAGMLYGMVAIIVTIILFNGFK